MVKTSTLYSAQSAPKDFFNAYSSSLTGQDPCGEVN